MQIRNKYLLKWIFYLRGNLTKGILPEKKIFDNVEITPYKNNANSAVTISADFELNWAFRSRSAQERDLKSKTSRKNIPYLLNLFNDCRIPITWATVGHLFLECCERGSSGLAHPNMPRPTINNRWEGDWYVHDPCTSFKKDPLWYAPDLIEDIIKSKDPSHEIGSHSFSHIDFSQYCSNVDLVRAEIEECIKVMERYSITPKSLVYPHNNMGHHYLDILRHYGITSVRHRDEKVRLSYPERTKYGVYKIYESMNTRSARYYNYLDKAKLFIQEAMKNNFAYHLWFHPSDSSAVIRGEFTEIIKYLSNEKDKGSIWVPTMSELVSYCETRTNTIIKTQHTDNTLKLLISSNNNNSKCALSDLTLIIDIIKKPKQIFLYSNAKSEKKEISKLATYTSNNKVMLNIPPETNSVELTF